MLQAKEKQAFEKILSTLNGVIDPEKRGRVILDYLVKQDIKKQVKPFFVDCLEELANDKNWVFPTEKLQKFLDNGMPSAWKTSMITDDLLLGRVPENEWHKYRDAKWVGENSKSKKSAAAAADTGPRVTVVEDQESNGRLVYLVTVETDLSELARSLEGSSGEDVDLEIENAFDNASLIKALDGPIWDYLRHKHENLSGSAVGVTTKPGTMSDLTENAKFEFEVEVSYDPPTIDENGLAEAFKAAFKAVV